MDEIKKAFEEVRKQPVFVRITMMKILQDMINEEMDVIKEEFGASDEVALFALYMKSMLEACLGTEKKEEPKPEIKEEPKKNKDDPFDGLKLIFKPDGTIDWEVKD